MNFISISNGRVFLTDISNKASYEGERFVLTKNKEPFAAIVSIEDLDLLESLEQEEMVSGTIF